MKKALPFYFIWRDCKKGGRGKSAVLGRHFNAGSVCPWAGVFVQEGDLRASGSGPVLAHLAVAFFCYPVGVGFFFACNVAH